MHQCAGVIAHTRRRLLAAHRCTVSNITVSFHDTDALWALGQTPDNNGRIKMERVTDLATTTKATVQIVLGRHCQGHYLPRKWEMRLCILSGY